MPDVQGSLLNTGCLRRPTRPNPRACPRTHPDANQARKCDRTNAESRFEKFPRQAAGNTDLLDLTPTKYSAAEWPFPISLSRAPPGRHYAPVRALATKLDATTILEDPEPFPDFYAARPGRRFRRSFLPAQSPSPADEQRQASVLPTTSAITSSKDKIFAYLNLDDTSVIYQRCSICRPLLPPPISSSTRRRRNY